MESRREKLMMAGIAHDKVVSLELWKRQGLDQCCTKFIQSVPSLGRYG